LNFDDGSSAISYSTLFSSVSVGNESLHTENGVRGCVCVLGGTQGGNGRLERRLLTRLEWARYLIPICV